MADGSVWARVRSSGLVDADWYRTAYPDLATTGVDPVWHYARIGGREGRDPNPLFRSSWYLTTYPDVAESGDNPLVHYVLHGAVEGRNPSPAFDTAWYLAQNPDVRRTGLNPLAHFLAYGQHEGRRPRPLPAGRTVGPGLRVVVVSGEPDSPGHRYRALRLADAVRRLGAAAVVLTVPEAASERIAMVDDADVVVLWRTIWGVEVERIMLRSRRAGTVVVFDVDDLMTKPELATEGAIDGIRSQGLTEDGVRTWFELMQRTARAADVCVCTTPELARHLRELGSPVHVLPNGFDDDVVTRSRLARRLRSLAPSDGLLRVGFASGSLTHQRDFAQAAPAVGELLRNDRSARLVLFRGLIRPAEFPALDGLHDQIEWRPGVALEDLPFELARFDVNLAPVEAGSAFCEAKSALKFFEAALVEVPTIASPTGPFRRAIADGRTGYLASAPDEWRDRLLVLAADREARRAVGRSAYLSVLWSGGVGQRAQTVQTILAQVIDDGVSAASAFELAQHRSGRLQQPAPPVSAVEVVTSYDRGLASRVTVVMPLHDYAEYVVEALESVRAQTLDDLDLVVVDDASDDDSLAVARTWIDANASRFNRLVLLRHSANAGLARTRNAAVDAAETTYVLPLDADNALLPQCAERLLVALDGTDAAYAFPRIRLVGPDGEEFTAGPVRGYLPYAPQRLVGSNYIDAMALLRKDAWLAAGGYREGIVGWEDYDLWCRFAELGLRGVNVAEDLAVYRVHAASMLHTVTDSADHLADVRAAISQEHAWLDLSPTDGGAPPAPAPTALLRPSSPEAPELSRPRTITGGRLSERARSLLPLLRCPVTGERVEETDSGLRTVVTGRRWPVVDGRPVLFASLDRPAVAATGHAGNPLPDRARELMLQASGHVLQLSGGGTPGVGEQVIELDAALFEPTDVVGDAHALPFADATFDLVVVMNAFEHYREPDTVVAQIQRVLTPGGLVLVQTAFLQPVHEAPHHYFNCTRHGLEQWFAAFETLDLRVSENFNPSYALAWFASEAGAALADGVSSAAAERFFATPIGVFADFWTDPSTRDDERWTDFAALDQPAQERIAAGFEYLGRSPAGELPAR